MSQKKWAAAETEFRQPVADDPASVKAHYNFASAESGENGTVCVGADAGTNAIDLSQPGVGVAGDALAEPERTKIAAQLAAAPGRHDAKCDAADAKQSKVLESVLGIVGEPSVTRRS